jgi:hypothetical protein
MNTEVMINKLLSEVPSFKSEVENNQDFGFVSQLLEGNEIYENPYTILQDFAGFVASKIRKQLIEPQDDIALQNSFEFIGQMLTSVDVKSDPQLLDLIYLGVLAILADEPNINEIAKKYLEGEALDAFQEYIRKIIQNEPFYLT